MISIFWELMLGGKTIKTITELPCVPRVGDSVCVEIDNKKARFSGNICCVHWITPYKGYYSYRVEISVTVASVEGRRADKFAKYLK